MSIHFTNRDKIIQALREELVGPSPQGSELDCSGDLESLEASYLPWRQMGSGEEILKVDSPTKRYGVGVLHPIKVPLEEDAEAEGAQDRGLSDSGSSAEATALTEKGADSLLNPSSHGESEPDSDDFDLSTANSYRPSSMGISFLAQFAPGSKLIVKASAGRYRRRPVKIAEQERIWWFRTDVALEAHFDGGSIPSNDQAMIPPIEQSASELDGLDLRIEVYSRPFSTHNCRLITVCFVNRSKVSGIIDEFCAFQCHFDATIVAPDGAACILPYPGPTGNRLDAEEQSLALLYRENEVYATGHGCSADWAPANEEGRVRKVMAECLPTFETPSITPAIRQADGTPIEVPMANLAGLIPENDGFATLTEIASLYEAWIGERQKEISSLPPEYVPAAERHLDECARSARRIRDGIAYLQHNPMAYRAFQLANHAILLQQLHSAAPVRLPSYDSTRQKLVFLDLPRDLSPLNPPPGRGKWRAFQIAFILAAIKSVAETETSDRETVELIWFPTGGGKTEAYLGLAAFSLFLRRLRDSTDSGVDVLMRYTLRLLTAQQFQRAAGLICAMEHIRAGQSTELGDDEFSIGIWLGGDTTPNTRERALAALRGLVRGDPSARNEFLLDSCPWCGAKMGPVKYQKRAPRDLRVVGYEPSGGTVVFKCPDHSCEFALGLPVFVVDEDIYEKRPSLIIGTVDKFAMLAWRPEARALFGFGLNGERQKSPPGLIIQDELHLISGPLGSMVGLYEALIEELCTDRRAGAEIRPKIISSTATIRRYADQIKNLYGRQDAALFPPPGLDVGDSFFARYARDANGLLERGRVYVGVHAPGLGSMQTAQVRTFSSVLQEPVSYSPEERDPWWTLVVFFNSLRELGTTLSLFQSDIPDYLKVIQNRLGHSYQEMRRLRYLREVTGRLPSDEIPSVIAELKIGCCDTGQQPVDACLASSIMEVGIDIERLSLMMVVGQPKTTSQYIQVTGRVGRRWADRPGLVVTIYSASKPRDRSHFEKFRAYHERLYAQVEPTSVTPFSPPALERALHAVMAGFIRQMGDETMAMSPSPYPEEMIDLLIPILRRRIDIVDPGERENLDRMLQRRIGEWRRWQRVRWATWQQDDDIIPLLRDQGTYVPPERALLSWPTPTSMRNVDAQCQAEITQLYLAEEELDA